MSLNAIRYGHDVRARGEEHVFKELELAEIVWAWYRAQMRIFRCKK
jgi:hypothetical protein